MEISQNEKSEQVSIKDKELEETKRIERAYSEAESNLDSPNVIGKLLATSIMNTVEGAKFSNKTIINLNLIFLAKYGEVLPLSWFTPHFLNALNLTFNKEFSSLIDSKDSSSNEILKVIDAAIKLWSYWIRRSSFHTISENHVQFYMFILEKVDSVLNFILVLSQDSIFEPFLIENLLLYSFNILCSLNDLIESEEINQKCEYWLLKLLNSSWLNIIGDCKQKELLEMNKPLHANAIENNKNTLSTKYELPKMIETLIYSINKAKGFDSSYIMKRFLLSQDALSKFHKDKLAYNRFHRQGLALLNLVQQLLVYNTSLALELNNNKDDNPIVVTKKDIKHFSNPFLYKPYFNIIDEFLTSYDNISNNKFWCIYIIGALILIYNATEKWNSLNKEIALLLKDNVNGLLKEYNKSEVKSHPAWISLFFVLAFTIEDDKYHLFDFDLLIQFLTGVLFSYFNSITIRLDDKDLIPTSTFYNNDAINQSLGRNSKLIGHILMNHINLSSIYLYSSFKSLFKKSDLDNGRSSLQNKLKFNKDILQSYLKQSELIYDSWDKYFTEIGYLEYSKKIQNGDIFIKTKLTQLRTISFSYVFTFKELSNRSPTSPALTDDEIQCCLISLSNLHFILEIQSPKVRFLNHLSLVKKLFNLVKERNNLLKNLLDLLCPYKIKNGVIVLPYSETLPATPNFSITYQSKEIFYLLFIENIITNMDENQIETYLLPIVGPYLKTRQVWSHDLYEASHCAAMALFKNVQSNSNLITNFAKWYQGILIEQYPQYLTIQQFQLAYLALVESIFNQDSELKYVWDVAGFLPTKAISLIDDIKNNFKQEDLSNMPENEKRAIIDSIECIKGYLFAFIGLLPKIPLQYLPTSLNLIKRIYNDLRSFSIISPSLPPPKSNNTIMNKLINRNNISTKNQTHFKLATLLLDTLSRPDISLSHRDYLLPFYLKFIKQD